MTTKAIPKVSQTPKKPKSPVEFEYLGVRPEVVTLLKQVEALFVEKHPGASITHSAALVNALSAYKARLKGLRVI